MRDPLIFFIYFFLQMALEFCWTFHTGDNNLSAAFKSCTVSSKEAFLRRSSAQVSFVWLTRRMWWWAAALWQCKPTCSQPVGFPHPPTQYSTSAIHHQSSRRYEAIIILNKVQNKKQKKRKETDNHVNHRSLSSLAPPPPPPHPQCDREHALSLEGWPTQTPWILR